MSRMNDMSTPLLPLSFLPVAFLSVASLSLAAPPVLAQVGDAPPPAAPASTASVDSVQQPRLRIGDAAPMLRVQEWLKGDALAGPERGTVYAIEFWATWCGPCIKAFPHLSELQRTYRDRGVRIVGVNIWEQGSDADSLAKVRAFVARQGDAMDYTVGFDGSPKAMTTDYMQAAGRGSIPTAFVVDREGLIAWIGMPSELDRVLKRVVSGKWSIADARLDAEAEAAVVRIISNREFSLEQTLDALASLEKEMPFAKPRIDDFKWSVFVATRQFARSLAALRDKVDHASATGDADELDSIARVLVDPNGPFDDASRDLELALRAARKAVELTDERDSACLGTLAAVWFQRGAVDDAIATQAKAVATAEGGLKAEQEARLAQYTAKRVPR